jgi:putative SOS response-associated peptidase YedK
MCYHAQQTKTSTEIQQRFNVSGEAQKGVFNGFSHPSLSVITAEVPKELQSFSWGLIPYWSKEQDIRRFTLNAKLETLAEKPSFRQAKRCLVITDGFYEWQWLDDKGKRKQKHLIGLADQGLFAFAGLCDEWIDRTTGDVVNSFSIVTTAAQGIMQEIHNSKQRMPLTLTPDTEASWLAGEVPDPFYAFKAMPVN